MEERKIKIAIVGLGNCASSLIQGLYFYKDVKAFNSIIDKVNNDGEIKLTKEEKTKLVLQLKENVKHIKKTMEKSWFVKKWLYKSMYNQYNNLLATHFEN